MPRKVHRTMPKPPCPPTLLCDFYKISHREQYPPGTEVVYSTWIPRMTHIPNVDRVVAFGFQAFVKEWLIDYFDEHFFLRGWTTVEREYRDFIALTLGVQDPDTSHLRDLWDLNYLPLDIRAVPEGTLVPLRVPMLTIENTDARFFWLTNFLETWMSSHIWQPCTSATIAHRYRRMFDRYALKTNPEMADFAAFQGHDFSMRGLEHVSASANSGMGHLLSFTGTDTIPAIWQAQRYYNADITKELVGTSIPACYDDKTEILTEHGFKPFCDLDLDEKVAQYNENGTIEFVVPSAYVDEPYAGDMVRFVLNRSGGTALDLLVTPNHRMVRRHVKTNALSIFEAASSVDMGFSSNWRLPVSGYNSGHDEISMMDRLRIAFQADGSFMARASSYTGERSGTHPIRFSLKLARKKERLRWILDSLGINYSWNEYENGYCSVRVDVPEVFQKDFSWIDLTAISPYWCAAFLEELTHWDGTKRSGTLWLYPSTNLSCIEQVQAVAALGGFRTHFSRYEDKREDYSRKTGYTVSLSPHVESILTTKVERETVPYAGRVYCVSVPTKMLVVRRMGQVAICGNTEHSVMCAGGAEDGEEYETYRRLIEDVYPNGFVSIVSDTWDLWHVVTHILPRLKDKIMARDGRVVIRPDSGDPADILCGKRKSVDERLSGSHDDLPEYKGLIELLWDIFGGTITSTGYKQLDSHIGAIYGDSITLERQVDILARLEAKGFASTNVVLGIGSYTYQYQTRDTFGFAMKSTWVQINGEGREIFKDPKTDNGTKKSLRGRVVVYRGSDGQLHATDGLTLDEQTDLAQDDELRTIFYNGKLYVDDTLSEIRERLASSTV